MVVKAFVMDGCKWLLSSDFFGFHLSRQQPARESCFDLLPVRNLKKVVSTGLNNKIHYHSIAIVRNL